MKPEDMSARVAKLPPRLRSYVNGLEGKIRALEEALGEGPVEFYLGGGDPPRRLPAGAVRMYDRRKRWVELRADGDRGFRLYASDPIIVAFGSTNLARLTIGGPVADLALHGKITSPFRVEEMKEFAK